MLLNTLFFILQFRQEVGLNKKERCVRNSFRASRMIDEGCAYECARNGT